jgi:bifunctional DNA-binding transcriptional regulator/antitoxin component of YhaV-PrlF toxin-antitoxin module
MSTSIHVNNRGTMTLPKALRGRLGLAKGGVVLAEESADGILLRPGVTVPIELYTDARIAEFDAADAALGRHLAQSPR